MTEESLKNLIDQENVCRCCLSTTGTWDLTAEYASTDEIKEVFLDMLHELRITLSYITEEGLSHFICSICLARLREACHFRDQVLRAEQQFIHFYENRKEKHKLKEVKVEIQEKLTDVVVHTSPTDAEKERVVKTDPEQKVSRPTRKPCIFITKCKRQLNVPTESTKPINKSCVIITKYKRKIDQRNKSSVSEIQNNACVIITKRNKNKEWNVPITESHIKNSEDMQIEESCNNSKIEDLDDDDDDERKTPSKTPSLQTEKDLMMTAVENDCLRMNIAQMLKYSTIVPFRYLQNTNSRYTCHYCKENYLIFSQLKQHFDENHANVTDEEIEASLRPPCNFVKAEISDIQCKLCREHFQDLEILTEHLVKTHQKQYYELKTKPSHGILGFIFKSDKLECHLCHKDFQSFRTLFSHMSQHFENFQCESCGKKFFCDRLFKCHLRWHQKLQYKCKFCDKTFSNGGVRANHMRKEHSYGMFKCSECGDTFDQIRLRLDHLVKVHKLEKRKFYCDICSKDFSSSGTLREHIRKHKVDQQYVCEICGKRCTHRKGMQIHMRVHSGERPYKCKFCDKTFATRNTLRLHVRGHQNDKRFVCEVCGAAFIQKHCLKRHYRVRHPGTTGEDYHLEAKKKIAS